jgi:hypothetical protein
MKRKKMYSTVFSALLIAALVFSLAAPMYAEAYVCPVHKQIVDYAWDLWADQPWMWEIGAHLGRIEGGACTDSHAEDYVDHVWDHYGTDGECITITHFWDPDNGLDDLMEDVALCPGENAAWKAMIMWGMALGEYHSGDKAEAYHYLGHIAHLLGDMSVPAHAHKDSHAIIPDSYDDVYMDQPGDCSIENAGAPECLSTIEKEVLRDAGPLVPEGPDKLHWLFYTTAQLAGMYASDDIDGNTDLDPSVPISVDFSEFDPGDQCDDEVLVECDYADDPDSECYPCMQVIRNNSYLRSIPATAALYKHFVEQSKKQEELTVVIDKIQQISGHTDDPDYFVRVRIGDFWFRNEGSQVGNAGYGEHEVGWAFALQVAQEGNIEVEIQLWDDDVGGYDKSDIYSGPNEAEDAEERAILLTVNLEKCRTGAPDAIGYDLTGACGVQLTSEGDDTDNSRIWFRILPPNSPPEANAGPDLTVNEGDYINILGQYDDPDQDDTHSFLWQMVSSTNGQVVPDDIGTVLSFIPCDNGVYTFRYTVTDNHGAQGSDEVVVTVTNVSPVVSAPYIFNQPNAEFILPVVHEIDFKGTFSDAGTCDTHTAVWDWNDGTPSAGLVTETDGSGNVTGSHIFSIPGDFTVTLTVTDDDGGSSSNTMTIHIADVGEALDIFNAYIQSLPSSVFKSKAIQRKKAFNNMFNALDDMLADQEYNGMILALNSNIRSTFDGLVGGSTKDDWIIKDLAIQTELCQKVDDITSYLRYLLSTMP